MKYIYICAWAKKSQQHFILSLSGQTFEKLYSIKVAQRATDRLAGLSVYCSQLVGGVAQWQVGLSLLHDRPSADG